MMERELGTGAGKILRWDMDRAHRAVKTCDWEPRSETLEQAMFRRCGGGGATGHYAPHPAQGPLADTQLALN
jgi:hypothetical protein